MADTVTRGFWSTMFGDIAAAAGHLGQPALLLGALIGLMTAVVLPLTWLAVGAVWAFRAVTLLLVGALAAYILRRKWRTMRALDASDTRANAPRRALVPRYLYRVALRPLVFLAVVLWYVVVLYTVPHAPLVALAALAVSTLLLVAVVRAVRRRTAARA